MSLLQSALVSLDVREWRVRGMGGWGGVQGGLLPLALGPLVVLPNKKQTAIVLLSSAASLNLTHCPCLWSRHFIVASHNYVHYAAL